MQKACCPTCGKPLRLDGVPQVAASDPLGPVALEYEGYCAQTTCTEYGARFYWFRERGYPVWEEIDVYRLPERLPEPPPPTKGVLYKQKNIPPRRNHS